jgi:hypothetical protein
MVATDLWSWRGQKGIQTLIPIWRMASLCLMWCVWRERNARYFLLLSFLSSSPFWPNHLFSLLLPSATLGLAAPEPTSSFLFPSSLLPVSFLLFGLHLEPMRVEERRRLPAVLGSEKCRDFKVKFPLPSCFDFVLFL